MKRKKIPPVYLCKDIFSSKVFSIFLYVPSKFSLPPSMVDRAHIVCSWYLPFNKNVHAHLSRYQFQKHYSIFSKMPGCSVIKCRSQGKGLHTFPADPDLRRQWILFCRRSPEWTPGPSARLCNDHFRPSDLKSWSGRVKDTAVPTIELCRSATETATATATAKRKKVGIGVSLLLLLF